MFSLVTFASLCLFSTARTPNWIIQFTFSIIWDIFRVAYRLGYTAYVVKQHLSTNKKFKDPVMVHPNRLDVSVGLQCMLESQSRRVECQWSNGFSSKRGQGGKEQRLPASMSVYRLAPEELSRIKVDFSHLKSIWIGSVFFYFKWFI